MFVLDKFTLKKIEETDTFGKFEIGPLPKGFGHTIGNPIRRILLTAISGSAVTSVKISGKKHEYSTLEGMQDDVLTFVLNLKNLAVISHSDEPVILTLSKKGEKDKLIKVTANDFEMNSDVEILNKDLVLAELTSDKVNLDVEVTIEKGVGYALPDEAKRREIGVIPVDSIFSPVKHVKLEIVNTRVGQETNLDQINLEVYTDGTVRPHTTMLEAVEIFDLFTNRLVDIAGGDSENNTLDVMDVEQEQVEVKKLLVGEAGLSTRLMNSLLNSGITDLMQLTGRNRNEILSFKGMGKKSFDELMDIIKEQEIDIVG